ncbi:MAG TPA: SRPBCC family protein [Hyphomonadaceae bacterium]|nr:SRPBCC family protein [Hyphomonadaceae bacterium]
MSASTSCSQKHKADDTPMPNKLDISLPSDREIRITRSFDAPRNLVWDCHTKPELVRRWLLGPPGWEMPVCEIDLRVGGAYRYEWVDKSRGITMGMGGTYTEVAKPDRIGSREKFDDDWTGGETLITQVFAEKAGKTTMTQTILYASKEARDGAAKTGMTNGMEFGYQRLDDLLAELA